MSYDQGEPNRPSDEEILAQKDAVIKQLLSPEARMRLNNVRMVKPDLALMVENYLIGAASQGKVRSQISDDQLKQLLLSIQQPKRDFKIERR
ncbi:MAG: DNA-binding protein [Candidatus Nitrosotenuis sp.]|nr:DNA-binding protein [Nitrososphaeria archaeon]NDF25347.1 DNA-binding protein [Nitrososphaerota archaeon]